MQAEQETIPGPLVSVVRQRHLGPHPDVGREVATKSVEQVELPGVERRIRSWIGPDPDIKSDRRAEPDQLVHGHHPMLAAFDPACLGARQLRHGARTIE
jgi:hypothetical protein